MKTRDAKRKQTGEGEAPARGFFSLSALSFGAWLLFGNAIAAAAVAFFLIPSGLPTAGVTGLALLFARLTGLPMSLFVLLLNLLFLILGYFTLGRRFFLSTLFSSLLYPLLLSGLTAWWQAPPLTDPLLSALFGGGLLGVGIGSVMRAGASTGGVDILQILLARHMPGGLSAAVLVTDLVVLLFSLLAFPLEALLYGGLLVAVESVLLERTVLFGKGKMQIKVVTNSAFEVAEALMAATGRGTTMLHSVSGYKRQKGFLVFSVLSARELAAARRAVRTADPDAFVVIHPVSTVDGNFD